METIADRVASLRAKANMSQSELGRKVGVTPQAIQAVEAGNVKRPKFIVKLAEVLKVSPHYLETGHDNRQQVETEIKEVPEYSVHVSAGGGALSVAENVARQWPFNVEYLQNMLGLSGAQLAIVEVRGDSMEPTLSSGDRVMVNMGDTQVSQPGIFVLWDGGGTVIKRVEKVPGQSRIVLISDNTLHGKYEIDIGEDDDPVKIVGRVVWAAKRL